jgi:undecaprenyl-diphosphatase
MDIIQALVIAILQGATELFPVSSLGHAVVLPALLHWGIDQNSPEFLPFLVMLHLGISGRTGGQSSSDCWVPAGLTKPRKAGACSCSW